MTAWRRIEDSYFVSGGVYVRWQPASEWHRSGDWEYGTKRGSVHCIHGYSPLLITARIEAESLRHAEEERSALRKRSRTGQMLPTDICPACECESWVRTTAGRQICGYCAWPDAPINLERITR